MKLFSKNDGEGKRIMVSRDRRSKLDFSEKEMRNLLTRITS